MRALGAVALAAAVSLSLVACAVDAEDERSSVERVDFLACAVSDQSGFNDLSFNEEVAEGLHLAETELNTEVPIMLESTAVSQFRPNLDQAVAEGCDITFAVGPNFSRDDVIFAAAQKHSEEQFVWADGRNEGQENLKPITFNLAESSYLAGYLAAGYSTSKVIGTYGSSDTPEITEAMDGYYYGALAWAEDNDTEVTVLGRDPGAKTGDFAGGFDDSAGAKQISDRQIEAGADVLFPVAGMLYKASVASIDAADKDVKFIGVDKNIALTDPQYAGSVLTSVEKRMTQAVYDVIAELVEGSDFEVEPHVGTLANGGTGLSDFYDVKIDGALLATLDELKQRIINGRLDPLASPEE